MPSFLQGGIYEGEVPGDAFVTEWWEKTVVSSAENIVDPD
jgi:hypothetical protein